MFFKTSSLLCLSLMASDGFQAAAGIAFYGYPNAATDTCIPDVVVYGGGTYGESPGIPDGSVVITYNGADLTFTDDFAGVVSTTMEVDLDVEICDLDIYIDIFYDWNNGGFLGLSTDGGINDLEVDLELQDSTLATVETRILDNDCGPDETVKELYSDEGLEGFSSACIDSVHIPKEPNGDLASFDGKSTQGTWSLKLDDTRTKARVHTNGGSVNCWALVVTPCAPTTPSTPDPRNGVGMGDPHFQTWVGEWFDFHGVCDLVFLSNPDFAAGTGMWIHIRTQKRHGYSYIESAAIKIGDDILEVGAYGGYMLNGVSNAEMPNTLDRYNTVYEKVNDKVHRFEIDIGKGQTVVVKTLKDLVAVSVHNATAEDFASSQGLLGTFSGGERVGRDGTSTIVDVNDFGMEWQVLGTEDMLFQDPTRYPQHPVQCTIPSLDEKVSRRLGETIAREAAEKACEDWEDMKEQCVFDVMASGDLELASAWAM